MSSSRQLFLYIYFFILKVCQLPIDVFKNLITSVQLGLTTFGNDIISLCCDFLQVLCTYVYVNKLHATPVYETLRPFLKVFDKYSIDLRKMSYVI